MESRVQEIDKALVQGMLEAQQKKIERDSQAREQEDRGAETIEIERVARAS